MLILREDYLIVNFVRFRPRKRPDQFSMLYLAPALPLPVSLNVVVQTALG
jgi:hypothetical protein